MLTLRPRTIDQLRADGVEDHLALHWEEIEPEHPLAINWPGYYSLERSGVLKPLGLYEKGRLIGYSVWFVQPPLHHSNMLWAVSDLLYVEPEHRARHGVFLMRESIRILKGFGVGVIWCQVKPRADLRHRQSRARVGRLLERLGFSLGEEGWVKYV
jgi:hypothetical protein